MIRHISLVIKQRAELPKKIANILAKKLTSQGIQITEGSVDPNSDAIIVLGGDGTLLHVAGQAHHLSIPLLGINLGGLGFLTEITLEEIDQAVDSLLKGDFTLDKRMMISVSIYRKDSKVDELLGLNEAVLTKGPFGRIITLPTWADSKFVNAYRGDGLIISTPTGSTAYNMSAGGPIIHPNIEALVLTPICPFALGSRPLILHGESCIEIEVEPVDQEEISLIIDGQIFRVLEPKDKVKIKKASGQLQLVKSPTRDYFTILREKLGWASDPAFNTETSPKNH